MRLPFNKKIQRLSFDEKVQITEPLAQYLLHDKDSVLLLLSKSLEGFDTFSAKLRKREQVPSQRRNLLIPNVRQALQLLVYEKSTEIEKELFSNPTFHLSPEHFHVLFIKYLVWQGTYHNVIWTGVGICKLLFDYQTAHLLNIFCLAAPNENAEEDHMRKIKGNLISGLCQHFGELLTLIQGERGRTEFLPNSSSRDYWEQVRQCLLKLLPLDTHPCPLRSVADMEMEIPALQFSGYHQCHVLICPDCLSRIVDYFGYDKLEEKLKLPESGK